MIEKIYVNRPQLAFSLALSETRIASLIQTGVLPAPKARGQYDLSESMRAYLRYLKSSQAALSAERTRLTAAKADRAELDLRHRAGELVEVEKVKALYFERGRQVRDNLMSIADRIAGLCAAESDQTKVHQLIYKELHQALEGLTS